MNQTVAWKPYLEKIPQPHQQVVVDVLKTAMSIEPEATASLEYGIAGLRYRSKGLLAVSGNKQHVGVYPMSSRVVSAIIQDHAIDYSKGTLRFPYDQLPSKELLQKIINLRKAEIEG